MVQLVVAYTYNGGIPRLTYQLKRFKNLILFILRPQSRYSAELSRSYKIVNTRQPYTLNGYQVQKRSNSQSLIRHKMRQQAQASALTV